MNVVDDIHIYSSGLVFCSVCVPEEMKPEQVASAVNAKMPTGISSDWRVHNDTFRTGEPNPHPCEKTDDRMHYLLSC